jgi:hypothetical protein
MPGVKSPLPVRQIAYCVPDAETAALAHHASFGSGPFFLARRIPLRLSRHRGVERPLVHSSAYGQWGGVMLEFVQQDEPGPSVFEDLYPHGSGRAGLHHVALFVDDLGVALADHSALGNETVLYAEMANGFAFAMVDAVSEYGHFLELYEPRSALIRFYAMVARAAEGWDGANPLRPLQLR